VVEGRFESGFIVNVALFCKAVSHFAPRRLTKILIHQPAVR